MKSSMAPNDAKSLSVDLDRLCALKPDELAERWRSLFGSDPPARIRRPLLIQALAYRLQEKASSGLMLIRLFQHTTICWGLGLKRQVRKVQRIPDAVVRCRSACGA
jgi:hypothetical protein